MAKAEDRFIRTYTQGGVISTRLEIWVDRKTGVNYLWQASGNAGGLSALLDREGKPVISALPVTEE